MISCTESNNNNEPAFDSIDFCSSWLNEGIKVFKSGKVYISRSEEFRACEQRYSAQLNMWQLDSISGLINAIRNAQLDTIFEEGASDHPISLSLLVYDKETRNEYSYRGDLVTRKYAPLYQLYHYIHALSHDMTESIDSDFVIRSRTRLILPPPPNPREN